MSRYTSIRTDLWGDEEFMELELLGKALYIYLLTSPLSNSIGYYKIPIKKIAQDMLEEEKKIHPILCGQTKLWMYDEGTKQVLIPSYLKYNKLVSPSQLKTIESQLSLLTPCRLHKEFFYSIYKYVKPEAFGYLSDNSIELVRAMIKGQDDRKSLLLNTILIPFSSF